MTGYHAPTPRARKAPDLFFYARYFFLVLLNHNRLEKTFAVAGHIDIHLPITGTDFFAAMTVAPIAVACWNMAILGIAKLGVKLSLQHLLQGIAEHVLEHLVYVSSSYKIALLNQLP